MTITDEVAKLITERDAALARERALEDQVERQKGGLLESRAQNEQLIKRNEKLAAQCARYDKHFRDALASSESIIKHRAELEPELPRVAGAKQRSGGAATLKSRLKRLAKNGGDAA